MDIETNEVKIEKFEKEYEFQNDFKYAGRDEYQNSKIDLGLYKSSERKNLQLRLGNFNKFVCPKALKQISLDILEFLKETES